MAETTNFAFFKNAGTRVKIRLISLLMLAFFVSVASGWIVARLWFWHTTSTLPEEVLLQRRLRQSALSSYAFPYELRSVSLGLTNKARRRTAYAQFSLVLDCPTQEALREMELNHARILDALFELATGYYVEDFSTSTGNESFRGAIKASLKAMFKENAPREIAIRDWVVH